jgi:flavodoxin
MLKKILITLLVLAVIGGIIALVHHVRVAHRNKKELANFAEEIPYTANLGRVLVIYYSWTGHTQDIAEQIAALTKGDTYRIQTQEEFKSSPAFYARLKKELSNKIYPALAGNLPDVSNYDVVFVGAPVWWYTMATPMYSFLGQMDFKNKKVIPFSTQGSNPGTFLKDFTANAQNAQVGNYANFNNVGPEYNEAVHNKIVHWLNNL